MVKISVSMLASALCALLPMSALADRDRGLVLTLSNQASGNSILTYVRHPDGHLTPGNVYPTGGVGTGAGLGSQGSISVSKSGEFVIVVNGGSNSISLFRKDEDELQFLDVQPSGGVKPISVTQSDRFVYVLNAGDATHADNIQEFVRYKDHLVMIPDGQAGFGTTTGLPVQVSFTPSGDALVVTEKGANLIDIFELDWFDRPISASFLPSAGMTPFGFDFGRDGKLFVTEAFGGAANASALSSYKIRRDLTLELISASVPTHQTAACWAVTGKDGNYVYAGNTGSGDVTGYRVTYPKGTVHLLTASGNSGTTGGATIDETIDPDGKFLYVLAAKTNTITAFRIKPDGSLENLGAVSGLPSGTSGLASE